MMNNKVWKMRVCNYPVIYSFQLFNNKLFLIKYFILQPKIIV
jgi:hypothetical protein